MEHLIPEEVVQDFKEQAESPTFPFHVYLGKYEDIFDCIFTATPREFANFLALPKVSEDRVEEWSALVRSTRATSFPGGRSRRVVNFRAHLDRRVDPSSIARAMPAGWQDADWQLLELFTRLRLMEGDLVKMYRSKDVSPEESRVLLDVVPKISDVIRHFGGFLRSQGDGWGLQTELVNAYLGLPLSEVK